jgi:hypothetical protein
MALAFRDLGGPPPDQAGWFGNNLATGLAASPQRDYNMNILRPDHKLLKSIDFRRHRNVLPMPRLGRMSSFRS